MASCPNPKVVQRILWGVSYVPQLPELSPSGTLSLGPRLPIGHMQLQ